MNDEVQQRTDAKVDEASDALSLAPKPAAPVRRAEPRRTRIEEPGTSSGLRMCPGCGHSRAFCACLPSSGTMADIEKMLARKAAAK